MQRITAIEDQLRHLQTQMKEIQQTVDKQQKSIDRIMNVLDEHTKATTQMQETLIKLTQTVTQLEKVTSKLAKGVLKDPPSPTREKSGKRLKLRKEDTSHSHIYQPLQDDAMIDYDIQEDIPPNLEDHNSRSTSPRL